MDVVHLASHAPERRRIAGAGTQEAAWRASSIARLPTLNLDDWVGRYQTIWLVAPHPDDEILGVGGTVAMLSARGVAVHVVCVTDGEASHGDSSTWTHERLARERPVETARGLDLLGVDATVTRLGLPDGRVDAHRQPLLRALTEAVGDDDLILTTCSFDGHPDHEACGEVAAMAAELTGAALVEYPVWMWHWATPDEGIVPWSRAHRIDIPDEVVARKRAAIEAFVSQITPDGPRDAILPPHVIQRFLRGYEVVFERVSDQVSVRP